MSQSMVDFLDLTIKIEDGRLSTTLFRKPTSTNSLLHFRSFHPPHIKKGIPTGQFLRIRRNCTDDQTFQHHAKDLTKRFRERDYPHPLISQAYRRVKGSEWSDLLQVKSRMEDKSLRFITPYNNQWSDLRRVLDNRWCILQLYHRLKGKFTDRPLLTAQRAPSLRDILVESHFSRPTTRLNRGSRLCGTYPCGDCTVCQFIKPATGFKNPINGEEHQANCYINCKTRYVVYCIQCPCSKILWDRPVRNYENEFRSTFPLFLWQTGTIVKKRNLQH